MYNLSCTKKQKQNVYTVEIDKPHNIFNTFVG